jgi:toxic protein SymE
VGYRPQGRDRSTPNLILSGKWLRADLKQAQQKLKGIEGALALVS